MAPLVSQCMIVKDEEENLTACLSGVADLVEEIIVVDTGSTDGTKECARRFGARLFDFRWIDDFAAARNESLRHATGRWIFWLDADDRLDADNRGKLRRLFAALPQENAGYVMQYRALNDAVCGGPSSVERVALFRRHPDVRWEFRVHEQIQASLERLGARLIPTDIIIDTVGQQSMATLRAKLERNYRLLALENSDRPGNPLTLWNLGRTALRSDRVQEAAAWLQQSLAVVDIYPANIGALICGQLAEALCRLGRFAQARTVCQEGRARFPQDTALLLAEGVVLFELGALAEAALRLAAILEREPGNPMAQAWLRRVPKRGYISF